MSVVLKGMTWNHPRGYDPMVACSQSWQEKTGVEIRWEKRSLQDFEAFPVETLARNYDLIIIDHPHVGQITGENCLLPLDVPGREAERQALSAASVGPSYRSYAWNERQWAFPIDAATQVQAWRPDRTDRPQTWGGDARARASRRRPPAAPASAFADELLHALWQSRSALPQRREGGSRRRRNGRHGGRAAAGNLGTDRPRMLRYGSDRGARGYGCRGLACPLRAAYLRLCQLLHRRLSPGARPLRRFPDRGRRRARRLGARRDGHSRLGLFAGAGGRRSISPIGWQAAACSAASMRHPAASPAMGMPGRTIRSMRRPTISTARLGRRSRAPGSGHATTAT